MIGNLGRPVYRETSKLVRDEIPGQTRRAILHSGARTVPGRLIHRECEKAPATLHATSRSFSPALPVSQNTESRSSHHARPAILPHAFGPSGFARERTS